VSDKQQDSKTWIQQSLEQLDALLGFAMALTSNKVDAEDLVQETYVQAMPRFDNLRADRNLKAWLFTIMRNTWLKKIRRKQTGPNFVELNTTDIGTHAVDKNDPQAVCIRIWEREEIRVALEQLPTQCREIVVLGDLEGFSYKEMAEILDCPVGTIMSRLSRARAKLKHILNSRWGSTANRSKTG
jgi:RNA polymerase sigma-70 factor (ECF subfamily)